MMERVGALFVEHACWSRRVVDAWAALEWASGRVDGVGSMLKPGLLVLGDGGAVAEARAAHVRIAALALDPHSQPQPSSQRPTLARL